MKRPILSYIVGAAGVIGGIYFSAKVGLWGYGKYKFKLEKEILYQDGYAFGGGFYLRL